MPRMMVTTILSTLTLLSTVVWAENHQPSVYTSNLAKIKAAYIYNIMKFTNWDESSLPNNNTAIRVGLRGTDAVTSILTDSLNRYSIKNRPIAVEQITANNTDYLSSNGQPFHLIYIAKNEELHSTVNGPTTLSTLLVGSNDQFLSQGGIVNMSFNEQTDRVSIIVNLKALKEKQLTLSAQLLNLATLY